MGDWRWSRRRCRPHVRLCLADMPWLCALDLALSLLDRDKYKRMKSARYPDARGLIADYAEAHPAQRRAGL